MPQRESVQDLIERYRRARRRKDPEALNTASLELGAALAKTGILAEISADGSSVTVWQPVMVDGGPPGFAHKQFRSTRSTAAPKYRPLPSAAQQTALQLTA
jgi:hypothetical protein